MPAAASHLRRLASAGVPLLALAAAAVGGLAAHRAIHAGTTYAGASTAAHAADLAAGLTLIGAGLVAWFERTARTLGGLALLAGATWFSADWEGWDHGPVLVRSVGAVVAPLFLVFVLHLVLVAPTGRSRSALVQAAVAGAYVAAVVVGVGRALVRDPILDLYCWRNCIDNDFLVHANPGAARAFDHAWLVAAMAIGVLLVAVCVFRLTIATRPARRLLVTLSLPGAVFGIAEAVYAGLLLHDPYESPSRSSFLSLFYARAAAGCIVAIGLLWATLRAWRLRAAVANLATELGEMPPPGRLREALAAAVGDPELDVAYWLPESNRYVDAEGKPALPPASDRNRAITPILRDGRPVAVVGHDPSLVDGARFTRQLGSAARLAVENERLQAEVRAQLEDLRASRARIVESADAARRRLERNLHDGAQQRLLALTYDIRLARAAAETEGQSELVALLDSAAEKAQDALAELRELAHGIYPAILGESGLSPALATLADGAPLPVELGEITGRRHPAPVETAAYLTVVDAIRDAADRKATFIAAGVAEVGDLLVVTTSDDGAARSSALANLADRIGALGGILSVGPRTLRAEIPCA